MENKKKPSILRLFPNHHDFEKTGVIFEPEMLTWSFFGEIGDKEIRDETYINIHRNALMALTRIEPFEVKIALDFDLKKKKLIHAHRTWGEIHLNDQCVLCFSHDTRINNSPFSSLYEWPEVHDTKYKNWNKVSEILSSWTVDQWTNFFKERLFKKAQDLKTKSIAKRNDVLDLERRADTLLWALATDIN